MKRPAEVWGQDGKSTEIASRAQETKIRGSLIIRELKPYCYWAVCNQSSCCSCQTEASQSALLWQCGKMQPDELTFQHQHHGQRLLGVSVSQLWYWRRWDSPNLRFCFVFYSVQSVIFIRATSNSYFHYWLMYQLFSRLIVFVCKMLENSEKCSSQLTRTVCKYM